MIGAGVSGAHAADDTIKVGILHSLSGTMAISETTLKDTVLFLIDEQNKKGGVLGKKLEAVVVDPASNWPLGSDRLTMPILEPDLVRRSDLSITETATLPTPVPLTRTVWEKSA